MNRSHLDKLAESYAQIAEGKKSEEEVKDWNRKDDNPQGKKVDKKKVDKCTCESFYLKRLQAINPVYAEQYRAIAEVLIGEGYESSRLLDNIIEALSMDVVGPEFVSAMKAVNPRIHENLETAEKKQARVIARNLNEGIRDVLPSWAGGKSDAEKETDRRAAELRRTAARERQQTSAGQALTTNTGVRYTRPTANTT